MEWLKKLIKLLLLSAACFAAGAVVEYRYTEPKVEKEVIEQPYVLDGWQLLTLSIIKTESDFNAQAMGSKQDLGILQITPIYVKEANRIVGEDRFSHIDAFDVAKSIEMFNIVQDERNPEHDIEKAIELHNPNGNMIGYADKVLSNFRYLSNVEEIRKQLINGSAVE